MKILRIRFQNLNSLTGIWNIDFTDPAYTENSLFAITGPTGAGKTTILDAICLALYGATPRLGKISKKSNEIMSRQCGACFAEVTFSTVKGVFRCHWSQHRSRQKAHGELQQPKHEIADGISNSILESRMRKVAQRVETVTGMDFDRFTRSTLLAQGGFAAFLQATADKRAPILEQITGTEIYSRLSIKVHELFGNEQKKLDQLEQQLSHINLLSPEDEEELRIFFITHEKQISLVKCQLTDLRKQQHWLENMAKLTKERDTSRQQLEELHKEEENQRQHLNRLQPALAAKELEPLYTTQQDLLKEQKTAVQEKQDLEKKCSTFEKDLASLQQICNKATTAVHQAETSRQTGLALISKVQKQDHTILSTKHKLLELRETLAAEQHEQTTADKAIKALLLKLKQKQEHKTLLETFFSQQAGDKKLPEEFAALHLSLKNLASLYEQNHAVGKTIKKAAKATIAKNHSVTALKQEHTHLNKSVQDAQKLVEQLHEKISELLHGKDPGTLQPELFRTRTRKNDAEQLQSLLEERNTQLKQLEIVKKHSFTTTAERAERQLKIAVVDRELKEKSLHIELLKKNILLLIRIQTLDTEREQLKDDTPCPLCGSLQHPYNQGNIPILSQEEALLEKARKELGNITEKLKGLTDQQLLAQEQLNTFSRQRKETEDRLVNIEKIAKQILSNLDFTDLNKSTLQELKEVILQLRKDHQQLQQDYTHFETLNTQFRNAEQNLKNLLTKRQKLETLLINATHQASTADKDEQRLVQQAESLNKELQRQNTDLSQKLTSYAIETVTEEQLPTIVEELRKRTHTWKAKKEEENLLTPQLLNLNSDLNHKQTRFTERTAQLRISEKGYQNTKKIFDELTQERSVLFGDKETAKESTHLEQAVKNARTAYELSLSSYGAKEKVLTASRALQVRLTTDHTTRTLRIEEQEKVLRTRIADSIFATLEEFLESRITIEKLQTLQHLHDTLQKKKIELQTLYTNKTGALQLEKEQKLCKILPDELEKKFLEQEKQLDDLQQKTLSAKEQLRINDTSKTQSHKQLTIIASQKENVGRWKRLHILIGSADGKKFRNFAQGLTFEMMIHHANNHLAKMNDRYILIRDTTHPLDLNVIDTFQADEIRSTKNLSGGESFLVSLALALGLSKMASQNVRVDSLFLDEGFGTLDEEALESALETLAQLREENKLIGIISHVAALKERVVLQIEIITGSRGQSSIKGPGVTMEIQ